MGENEQGGMLRVVVVVGLVALISIVIITSVIGLKGKMSASQNNATDNIATNMSQIEKETTIVTDKADNSKYTYSYDESAKTATITGTVSDAFANEDIVLPTNVIKDGTTYSVTGIGIGGMGRAKMKSATIPASIKTIDMYAFMGDSTLTSVDFAASLDSIGDSAFVNTGLTAIDVKGTKKIGDSAFQNTKITSVKMSSGVEVIGTGAFQGLAINSITIPDTVYNIGYVAFNNTNINTVHVPFVGQKSSTEYIQKLAFNRDATIIAGATYPG